MQLRAPNFCTVALGSLQLDVALFDINSTKRINEFTLTRNLLFLFYCVTHNSNQYTLKQTMRFATVQISNSKRKVRKSGNLISNYKNNISYYKVVT